MISSPCLQLKHILSALACSVSISAANAKPGPHPPFKATGAVTDNHDGDTIKLQTADRGLLVVRLSGADAPETGQAYWRAARGYLRSLVAGQETTVWCYKRDRYEREVCHVRVGNQDVCEELIRHGYAWYAHMFGNELSAQQREVYTKGEQDARAQRVGLWSDPDPLPPWECRKLRKAHQKCR